MTTTVKIHAANTHLSRRVEQAAQGHEFVIAKAAKPMVRVVPIPDGHRWGILKWPSSVPIEAPPTKRRLGTMAGQGTVELDLKKGFEADINPVFGLGP